MESIERLISKKMMECLETFADETPTKEKSPNLKNITSNLLKTTLSVTKGLHGYVACSNSLEDESLHYVAIYNMENYISLGETFNFSHNRTMFVPTHMKKNWIFFPLFFRKRLCSVFGIENLTGIEHSILKPLMRPLFLVLSNIIGTNLLTVEVSNAHDMFLSTMSHEIRTPLNGIVGMARLLKESEPLTDLQKENIDVISSCSFQLIDIINDILDFSKMGCGRLKLEEKPFDLYSCLEEAYDVVFLKAQEKKLHLWFDVNFDVSSFVVGDKKRIRQILINLLSNAIKYTEHGHITVRVNASNISENDPYIISFEVEDTGCGIPAYQFDTVFNAFQQANKETREGTGLGLAICKKLSHLMGGSMRIKHSVVGKGTCMEFQIPLSNAKEDYKIQKEKKRMAKQLKDKTVLVVDPSPQTRIGIMSRLTQLEMKPLICNTCEEALLYLQTDLSIDVVIADVDVVEKLTKHLEYNIPIVILKELGRKSPKTDHRTLTLRKDSYQTHLEKVLYKVLAQETTNTPETSPQSSSSKISTKPRVSVKYPNVNILIVEDNPYNLRVASQMLEKIGYNPQNIGHAKNGIEAIQYTSKKFYDIILMDLIMPSMNGYDATSQILNHFKKICPHKHLYDKYDHLRPTIVAMTACVMDNDREKCKKFGMSAFLGKPINKDELETMLDIVLRRRDRSKKIFDKTFHK